MQIHDDLPATLGNTPLGRLGRFHPGPAARVISAEHVERAGGRRRPRRLLMALLLAAALLGRAVPAPAQETGATAEPAAPTEDATTSAPVPVPEPSEKAMRYYRSGVVLWVVGLVWGLLVPAALLFSGASARIRSLASRTVRGSWLLTIGLYCALLLVLLFLLDLPLSYYAGFVRPHAYDLSSQTLGKWLGDAVKGLGVSVAGGVLFLWVPYLLLARSPRRWWLYTALLALPFFFFMAMIAPVWIDPLFNDFGPMADKELEARILALAERSGIEGSRVFEVDKSVDTKTVNAYVTGFLGTKRIVLWDTILAKLEPEEILFVMGHEMGHYVLGHVVRSVFFAFLLLLVALWVIHRIAGRLIERYRDRFGFERLSDVASVPLLMLLFGLIFFVAEPLAMTYSRSQEHEADRFGLELTRDNRAGAMAFVKLQHENLSNPRPAAIDKIWRWSHPTLAERIEFCNAYRPWESGRPLRYADRFRADS